MSEPRFLAAFLVLLWLGIYGWLILRENRAVAAAVCSAVLLSWMRRLEVTWEWQGPKSEGTVESKSAGIPDDGACRWEILASAAGIESPSLVMQ